MAHGSQSLSTEGRLLDSMEMVEKIDMSEMAVMELRHIQVMKPPIGRVGNYAMGSMKPAKGRWLMGDDPRQATMTKNPPRNR
jgi:hypothetical protein